MNYQLNGCENLRLVERHTYLQVLQRFDLFLHPPFTSYLYPNTSTS